MIEFDYRDILAVDKVALKVIESNAMHWLTIEQCIENELLKWMKERPNIYVVREWDKTTRVILSRIKLFKQQPPVQPHD